jgi:hypothetical protein
MMKKQLQQALLLGMVFLCGNAFGQTTGLVKESRNRNITQGTYLDLLLNLVGTNINYGQSNRELSDYKKANLGLQAGVAFQAGMTPKVSLASEFYFLMKGGRLNAGNPLTPSKTTLRFYALELPVLARFHLGRFYVNAGPSLAYTLYGTRKMEGSTSALPFNRSGEGFRRLEAGIQVGGGYRFKVKRQNVALDIRYSNGLTNISRSQEMYNRYLNISLRFSKPWKANPIGRK